MLHTETVDTRRVAPADRWAFWNDIAARSAAPLALTSDHAADFRASTRMVDLGGIRLARFRYQSLVGHRTPKLIRQADPEVYQLALTLTGSSTITAHRRDTALRNVDFTLIDWGRPHRIFHASADGGRQQAASVTAVIPRAMLRLDPNKLDRVSGARMSGAQGMGALVAQHLNQLTRHPEQYDSTEAPRLAGITVDLISALLARHIDAEADLPVDVRQQAMLSRVCAFIHGHLGDATLTPQIVADAHHISLRTLHRLFEHEDDTVGGRIRNQRLEHCRRDLEDPMLRSRAIQMIAARWGFTDKAAFSRAFRAAYGMGPHAYRAAHQLAPTVNWLAPSDNTLGAY